MNASDFGLGGCLFSPGQPEVVIRGYWGEANRGRAITVKEIQALYLIMENLLHHSENTRVDVFSFKMNKLGLDFVYVLFYFTLRDRNIR